MKIARKEGYLKNCTKRLCLILAGVITILYLTGCTYFQTGFSENDRSPDTDTVLQVTDYSKDSNWAYVSLGNGSADLFLICPTVYKSDDIFNMPIDDDEQRRRFVGALNMERGIYEDSCRMFAPFYRQVSLSVYDMDTQKAEPYFELAYTDIKNAFLYYIEAYNNGRPFVLAGFSQGSDMALRLMKDCFGSKEINELLIASYLIGWRVTADDLNSFPHLKMAAGEIDTGVIVSFNSEAENVEKSMIVPEKTYAINPLNWRTDSAYAPKELNKGACFPNTDGVIESEIPHLTGAYLDSERGVLKVPDVSPDDYPPGLDIFEEGVYHIYDYQFFYRNLQENVAARSRAYIENTMNSP